MSLNRFNPRRDDNEPDIRKRFATHGWHTEQRSSPGGWDLDAYPPHRLSPSGLSLLVHVDVKMPGKGVTTAQVKKWTALSEKRIPVYVASTEADVDAIVSGTATPWAPSAPPCQAKGVPCTRRKHKHPAVIAPEVRGSVRAPRPHGNTRHLRPELHPATKPTRHRKTTTYDFVPPRSPPVDASALAAETFAPSGRCSVPRCLHAAPCPRHSLSTLGRT